MIIGLDASRAINESAGIARYNKNLLAGLSEIDKKNQYKFLFTYVKNKKTKDTLAEKLTSGFKNKIIKVYPIPGRIKETLWGSFYPIIGSLAGKCDIWHATSFFEASLGDNTPMVVTIHDMSTFLFPSQRGESVSKRLSIRTGKVLNRAKRVIAVSESTKKDILKFFPSINKNKIKVIYLSPNPIFQKIESIKKEKIILTVGTIEPRKNLRRLINAYVKLPKKIINNYKLVIVGANGWNNSNIYESAKKLVKEKRIIFTSYLPDDELAVLYNKAEIFVYPSLYEGFGLPVLEAMKSGLPVITSNISSLPEVVGKSGILVDPHKTADITASITKLIENKKLREKLSSDGLVRANRFTNARLASETLKVYKEVYEEK